MKESEASEIVTSRTGAHPRAELVLREDPGGLSLTETIAYLIRIPTYTLLIIASSLSYYFVSRVRAFGMIYFTQQYEVSRGIVGGAVILIGAAAIASGVTSGRVSERLLERGCALIRITLPGVALFTAVLFFAPAIWTTNVFIGVALLMGGFTALSAANPPIDAARLDIVLPSLWGRAEAGRTALRGVLEGGAPLLVGFVSDPLGGGSYGLKWALLLMLIPLIAASFLAIPICRAYPRDVATARASIVKIEEARRQSKLRGR